SEKRKLKLCCAFSPQYTTTRCLAPKSKPSIRTLFPVGQATVFWPSILTDNLLGLHESSGVPAVSGQSFEVDATQMEPLCDWVSEIEQNESDSANSAAAGLSAFI